MTTNTIRKLVPLAAVLATLAVVLGTVLALRSGQNNVMVGADGSGTSASGAARPAGGGTSGSTGSGEPVDPGAGATPSRFQSVVVAGDGRSVTVTFFGGVEKCYSYALRAKEAADAVYLVLVETKRETTDVCIELAVERHAAVELTAPLGERKLIDADSGGVLRPVNS